MKNEANKIIHDIRNRLNTISMQTELARMLVQNGADSTEIIRSLEKVLTACEICDSNLQYFHQTDAYGNE